MNARNVGLNDASRASIDAKFASRAVRSLHDAHDLFFAIDKVLLPRAVARVHRGAAEFRKRDDVPDLNLCASSEPSSIPSSVIVVVIVVTVVCSSRFAFVSRFIARARRVSHPTARARRSSFVVPVPWRSLSPRSSASASSSRDSPRQSFILCFSSATVVDVRVRARIHAFIHSCIHACNRASPPTILREPSSSSSTHRLPRHALRQQHPPHGFRRGRDALHQHAVHERSERASSRHPPASRRRVRRDRASNRIESNPPIYARRASDDARTARRGGSRTIDPMRRATASDARATIAARRRPLERRPGRRAGRHRRDAMDARRVTMERVRDNDACAKALADAVETASREAIEKRGTFAVALAGGSLAKALGALREETRRVEWDKWRVFWVDERCVKWDDEESNFGGAMRALFGDVSVKRERLYAVDETLCERNEGAAKPCAEAYERDLRALTPDVIELNEDGLPVFDMLLLGFGPDGHICSLFPNHALLRETEGWILPIADSPKPPPERVTFSLPLVNAARAKVFVASGAGKAEMTARILEEAPQDGSVPAALVTGDVRWIVDDAAASKMRNS
jgi:6-phosphogluconolactonase